MTSHPALRATFSHQGGRRWRGASGEGAYGFLSARLDTLALFSLYPDDTYRTSSSDGGKSIPYDSTVTNFMSAGDLHAKARFNMVESQIRTNKVTDERLLAALSTVPRQIFVPNALASVAYVDSSIRIANDRYLVEPLVLARLLQEATVDAGDAVLVVGAGTGYSTAILSGLAASVTAVESDLALAVAARENLAALGFANVTVHEGSLAQGWAAGAPYDVIVIDGMIADLPAGLTAQLADHGRLVTIRAQEGRSGAGTLYRKLGGSVSGRPLFDAFVPFLPGFAPRPEFAF